MNKICKHPLRWNPTNPAWLACDIHRADFPHQIACPGHGTPGCIDTCAGGEPDDEQLLALAVELLAKTPATYGLDTPCGAVPPDLARALVPLLNQPDGGSGLPEYLRADLVAVARALLGRTR
jgi:hypothetical protein